MRGKERELIVLRSDNGDTWKEQQFDIRAEDLTELLAGMDEGESLSKVSSELAPTAAECFPSQSSTVLLSWRRSASAAS